MTIMKSFVALVMATVTGFSSTYSDPDIRPAPVYAASAMQYQIDEATQVAYGSGLEVGITVIDRARGNMMKTNDEAAHRKFLMDSAGRLPILLHVARIDGLDAVKSQDVTAMMQAYSGESTQRLWEKYGGTSIISDIARRYNLQETTSGNTWRSTESSSVDMGRMYRRFLDDKSVDIDTKKEVVTLLRNTSPTVVGEDFSFGLPNAVGVNSQGFTNNTLAWVQGWSASGQDEMVRTSTGILGEDMRFIVIITGKVTDNESSNDMANSGMNSVAQVLLGARGDTPVGNTKDVFGNNEEHQEAVEEFLKDQIDLYGEDFIENS